MTDLVAVGGRFVQGVEHADGLGALDSNPLRVAVVTSHIALGRGIELLLRERGLEVVGSARDPLQAAELVRRRAPKVLLVDLAPSRDFGPEQVRHLVATTDVPVLLYGDAPDDLTMLDALEAGAVGFALKVGGPDELEAALRIVGGGESYVDPRVQMMAVGGRHKSRHGLLSAREREILQWLGRGLSGDQIAGRLFLSPETVRTHVRNAMRKLEASTRVHAVVIAAQRHEISWAGDAVATPAVA